MINEDTSCCRKVSQTETRQNVTIRNLDIPRYIFFILLGMVFYKDNHLPDTIHTFAILRIIFTTKIGHYFVENLVEARELERMNEIHLKDNRFATEQIAPSLSMIN